MTTLVGPCHEFKKTRAYPEHMAFCYSLFSVLCSLQCPHERDHIGLRRRWPAPVRIQAPTEHSLGNFNSHASLCFCHGMVGTRWKALISRRKCSVPSC